MGSRPPARRPAAKATEHGPRSGLAAVTPERYAALTKSRSKHVYIENIGAQAAIEVAEYDSDGVVIAVVRIEPGDAAQFTPTARHAVHVMLIDD